MHTSINSTRVALIAPLSLAACSQPAPREQSFDTGQDRAVNRSECADTQVGLVGLKIDGRPGDAFRITLLCDNQRVAQCQAQVAAGGNAAVCTDGPNPARNGTSSCVVQPANGNSARARVRNTACTLR